MLITNPSQKEACSLHGVLASYWNIIYLTINHIRCHDLLRNSGQRGVGMEGEKRPA